MLNELIDIKTIKYTVKLSNVIINNIINNQIMRDMYFYSFTVLFCIVKILITIENYC